jgi:hypothetical protein
VYCQLGLDIPKRTKMRVPERDPVPLQAGTLVNQGWALDFMHDVLYDWHRFRTLNVIDEANREALLIEVGISIPSAQLIRALDRLIEWYGVPDSMRRPGFGGVHLPLSASNAIHVSRGQPPRLSPSTTVGCLAKLASTDCWTMSYNGRIMGRRFSTTLLELSSDGTRMPRCSISPPTVRMSKPMREK